MGSWKKGALHQLSRLNLDWGKVEENEAGQDPN